MAVLEYYGELWGYSVLTDEGGKVLCYSCFSDAKDRGQVKKITKALGTEDITPAGASVRDQRKSVYACDECCNDCIHEEAWGTK